MRTNLYRNNRNANKYIEIRHYNDGHYVVKQFVLYFVPNEGRNYTGCTLKRSHKGTWRRITKNRIIELVEDYTVIL